MNIHELKAIQPYFGMVVDGHKHFEFRKNDRMFGLNDLLFLREWDGVHYTGKSQLVQVVAIVNDRTIGIPDGYVIMEIRKVKLEF